MVPDTEAEKRNAAFRAVAMIENDMTVGLGTGTTATHAIRELGRRVTEESLRIAATATSTATEQLARSVGITVRPMGDFSALDLGIDGADEIDPELRMIKGGGGALFRERIVAAAAVRMIIIVDSNKPVEVLGRHPLPVEVHPFALASARRRLEAYGRPVRLRRQDSGEPFLTDQQANIFDVAFGRIDDPVSLAAALDATPGVFAHGLFIGLADTLIVGTRSS